MAINVKDKLVTVESLGIAYSTEQGARQEADQALSTRIDNIVAPDGDPSLTEVSDARVSGSTTHNTLKARLDADQAAVGTEISAINESLGDVRAELNKYNAYDVLTGQLSRTSGTHNGITFTWSGDVCDVDGTSDYVAVNIIRSSTTLPPEIIPGQDCYVKYSTTDSNVQLRIIFKDSSDAYLKTLLLAKDTSITVPAGATKYTIALYVASGKTINHATISVIALLSAMSNMDLWKGSLINRGALPDGTDLDNVTQPGFYTLVEGRTYPNSIGGEFTRILEVFNTATYVYQSITVLFNERVYRRFYSQFSSGWYDWDKGTIYSEKFISKGLLPDGTDLDDVTEEGHYLITNSYTYANAPYETPVTYSSTLEVLHTTNNTILQRVIDGNGKNVYIRQTTLGVFPTTWRKVSDFVKREMVYNDLDEDTYVTFRVAMYVKQEPLKGYRSYLLPVQKGNTIRLRTAAMYPIGTYAIAKSNYLVTYKHPYAEDQTAVTYVDDTFDVTADGFIAINCLDGYHKYFLCEVDYGSASDNIRNNLFVNALKNPYNFIPEYDDSNPTKVLKKGPSLIGAIHHWGVIGASYDTGELNYTKPGATEAQRSTLDYYEYSWMSELARVNGIKDVYHYANGGQNAKQWITLTGNPQIDGTARGYFYSTGEFEVARSWSGGLLETAGIGPGGGCWWKLKADYAAGKAKQAYVIVLGSNDINNNNPHDSAWNELADGSYDATRYYKAGSIEDIGTYDLATDTDTVPPGKTAGVVPGIVNSYAAYIGAILNRVIAQQPDCVIFLATIRNIFAWNENSLAIWNGYNDVLRQIAQMERFRGNVLLIDFAEYGPNYMQKDLHDCLVGMHLNAIGYHEMAYYYGTLIDYAIRKNFKMLAQSAFIGTNFIYRYDS